MTMTSTVLAPELRTGADSARPSETRLDVMSRANGVNSRVTLRVLIANQQPIVRHGLQTLIANETDLQVVGETDDGGEAVRLAQQLRPNVVLIDLSMPTVNGISAT